MGKGKAMKSIVLMLTLLNMCACARVDSPELENRNPKISCPDPDGRKRLGEGATYRDLALSRAESIGGWQQCHDALVITQR